MEKKINNAYIGVFDSGIGGLTCLKDLKEKFKGENFLYLGDTKRCPYGVKTKEEIEKIVESDIKFFEKKNVKMIVIACNTATANSYHINSSIPIIRIIEPTAKKALNYEGNTAILATNYTINSKAYEKFYTKDYIGIGCSEWVNIIENINSTEKEKKETVAKHLAPVKGRVNNVVLACTHFGLLEAQIKDYLGPVNIIDSSKSLSEEVKKTLEKVGYNGAKTRSIKICVTGDKKKLNISWFTDEKLDIEEVDIDE